MKNHVSRQGGSTPNWWTEGRFIMNRLEVPTLKEIPAERIYEQVLVGGGSILLKKHIEASGKVSLPIFVDEISANTKGYELLFKAACMG